MHAQLHKPATTVSADLLTNAAQVLLLLAGDGQPSQPEIAKQVGLSPEHVRRILDALEAEGYLIRHRNGPGKRSTYQVCVNAKLTGQAATVGDLVDALAPPKAH